MNEAIVRKTFRRSDFASNFYWREFCEELGLDPIAPEIEVAIIKAECKTN
ncbi:MAG: hypothetical protein KAQ79_15590 [Cyclobacteriaceae bacterium]|nr:hypothetical protein [Cyclobacteriaceae bacterium]